MNILTAARRILGYGLAALLIGWWSTGCVKVEQTLKLEPDGSGTIALRYGMSLEDLAEMEAMAKAQMGEGEEGEAAQGGGSPFEFDEAEVRKDFEEYNKIGVTLEDIRTEVVDGWKYLSLRVAFQSLEGLGQTEFLSDRMVSLKRLSDGNYEFVQSAPPGPEEAEMAGMEQMMADMMKGFRAALKFQAPGELVESNADSTDGRTVEWVFDLDKDAKALRRAQKMALRVVFKGDGLKLKDFASQARAE